MKPHAAELVHALEIPLLGATLLFPSAAVAEVINVLPATPIPYSDPWQLGVIGWRSMAVPLVSFEVLLGSVAPVLQPASKIVIFYPLSGRKPGEFFGIYTISEPRPLKLDGSHTTASPKELPDTSFIAAGLKMGAKVMLIPDLEKLKATFYPS